MARLDLRILETFGGLVLIDKPAGWLSVPGRQGERDERPVAGLVLQKNLGTRIFPVHRLDAEVGGLMLFATDPAAQSRASRWFERRTVRKEYQALTGPREFRGWPANLARQEGPLELGRSVTWRCRILRGKKRSFESPHGDSAETEVIAHGERADAGIWAWTLWPRTGRPHQLRLELARHGFAILGDTLYGSDRPWPTGIALRSVALDFREVPGEDRQGLPETIRGEELFR